MDYRTETGYSLSSTPYEHDFHTNLLALVFEERTRNATDQPDQSLAEPIDENYIPSESNIFYQSAYGGSIGETPLSAAAFLEAEASIQGTTNSPVVEDTAVSSAEGQIPPDGTTTQEQPVSELVSSDLTLEGVTPETPWYESLFRGFTESFGEAWEHPGETAATVGGGMLAGTAITVGLNNAERMGGKVGLAAKGLKVISIVAPAVLGALDVMNSEDPAKQMGRTAFDLGLFWGAAKIGSYSDRIPGVGKYLQPSAQRNAYELDFTLLPGNKVRINGGVIPNELSQLRLTNGRGFIGRPGETVDLIDMPSQIPGVGRIHYGTLGSILKAPDGNWYMRNFQEKTTTMLGYDRRTLSTDGSGILYHHVPAANYHGTLYPAIGARSHEFRNPDGSKTTWHEEFDEIAQVTRSGSPYELKYTIDSPAPKAAGDDIYTTQRGISRDPETHNYVFADNPSELVAAPEFPKVTWDEARGVTYANRILFDLENGIVPRPNFYTDRMATTPSFTLKSQP